MAGKKSHPRVYADSCVFMHVIQHEPGFWPSSQKVLMAAERGNIRLVVSTLALSEISGWRGDLNGPEQDRLLAEYLTQGFIEWVELDLYVARNVRALARERHLRGADAAHLATAVNRRCDYFMSTDGAFPYGEVVEGVKVMKPDLVWDMTTDDATVDSVAAAEEERAQRELQSEIREAVAADATAATAAPEEQPKPLPVESAEGSNP